MIATPQRSNHKKRGWIYSILVAFLAGHVVLSLFYTLHSPDAAVEAHRRQASSSIPPPTSLLQLEESLAQLRKRLPPSIWTTRVSDKEVAAVINAKLSATEKERAVSLCGKFLYSSLRRAVQVGDMGQQTFVATGDIDDMWTRDSAVQMGIYMNRQSTPWLRLIVEGAIRRQAFHTIQDPYANAYERKWVNPDKLPLRDRVIGRGGWVATRNYELDSGAYFLTQLYDYYVQHDLYQPHVLLEHPMVFDAVMLTVDTWMVEQHHDEKSPYRYFELPNQGKGTQTAYTGMTWSGFRPSDDPCHYGYLIPSNIFAAAGLERVLELNKRVWKSNSLQEKASQLLKGIEEGIRKFGVVKNKQGDMVYAYEVNGMGDALLHFDDANVPSLLSIPLLGWSGYDKQVYQATRKMLLSPKTNDYYLSGDAFRGMGSPHTPRNYVWPMAFAMEALTAEGSVQDVADTMLFEIRQSLKSACGDAMHEGVDSVRGCTDKTGFSRAWFEWANALFVVLVESALGESCDASGQDQTRVEAAGRVEDKARFYSNPYQNEASGQDYYQGIEARVVHYE